VPRSKGDSAVTGVSRRHGALLLNATHEPLAVLSVRRAMVLVLSGKADCLVTREGENFHTPTRTIPAPVVLRLRRYLRIPFSGPATMTRAGVLRRDRRRCVYCHGPGSTIDHVVPRSRGGAGSWANCVTCCVRCNTAKSDRLLIELGWPIPVLPVPPRRISGRPWLDADIDPAWQPWLAPAA